MPGHCSYIMSDQHTIQPCGEREHVRIACLRRDDPVWQLKTNGRLQTEDAYDNPLIEIRVRKKP